MQTVLYCDAPPVPWSALSFWLTFANLTKGGLRQCGSTYLAAITTTGCLCESLSSAIAQDLPRLRVQVDADSL